VRSPCKSQISLPSPPILFIFKDAWVPAAPFIRMVKIPSTNPEDAKVILISKDTMKSSKFEQIMHKLWGAYRIRYDVRVFFFWYISELQEIRG
jgi:hypothetical protein